MKKTIFSCLFLVISFSTYAQQEELLKSVIDIVSPIEAADLIKKQGIKYDNTLLNKPENSKKYLDEYKQALNLGVFSTAMGYATINDQSKDALGHLGALKGMATALKVEKYINMGRIFTLASNKKDLNKLLDETTSTFENISDDLNAKKKSNLSALIITGGWVETFYLTTQMAQKNKSQELNNRIVEQKLVLTKIVEVLANYKTDKQITELGGELAKLDKYMAKFKIEHKEGEQKVKETGDVMEIQGSNVGKDVELSANDLTEISKMIADIRTKIVQ
jgi:hypothetical protein